MFNYEQYMGALRWAMAMGSGYAIGKGWGDAVTWTAISGAVASVAPLGWTLFRHTKVGTILAANSLPEVAGVITKPTEAGEALARETPAQTVTVAGTQTAAVIAKATI